MAEYKLMLPPMGEGVMEATITGWIKNEGDFINEDDSIIEIATDKVDSDVPSPVSGKLLKKLKSINDICKIGDVFAILEIDDDNASSEKSNDYTIISNINDTTHLKEEDAIIQELEKPLFKSEQEIKSSIKDSFLSPLVKNICKEESISEEELNQINGSGLNGRITKEDIINYLEQRKNNSIHQNLDSSKPENTENIKINNTVTINSDSEEIIEMDRMRKLISEHMMHSKQVSAHVTSFVEADVTNIVLWRNKYKDIFLAKEGEKLTFMPFFIQAIAKAIKDFPMINISIEGDKIIKKKNINIGMATALSNGNLIVPVIKNADKLNLSGLTKVINDLAERARNNKLKPEEAKGGTYTITNVGSFGNIAGTPIINQPEVAIMAVGSIVKKPAVIETPQGDLIGIRHKMILSHTYDHRVIDGALGGSFVKKVADYLESFNLNMGI